MGLLGIPQRRVRATLGTDGSARYDTRLTEPYPSALSLSRCTPRSKSGKLDIQQGLPECLTSERTINHCFERP